MNLLLNTVYYKNCTVLKWSTLLRILLWIYWEIAPINISVQHEVPSVLLASCDSIISFRTVPVFFKYYFSFCSYCYLLSTNFWTVHLWMNENCHWTWHLQHSMFCTFLYCCLNFVLSYQPIEELGWFAKYLLLRFAYQIAIKSVEFKQLVYYFIFNFAYMSDTYVVLHLCACTYVYISIYLYMCIEYACEFHVCICSMFVMSVIYIQSSKLKNIFFSFTQINIYVFSFLKLFCCFFVSAFQD